jgi:HrpA-like RNA helicase
MTGAIAPDEHLTSLGKHLSTLPVEPTIGKALIYSALLRYGFPVEGV